MWVVLVVGAITLMWMAWAVIRILGSRADESGELRLATDVESGLVGGTVPEGAHVFDAWSYRVGARYAGRVRIAVYPDTIAVAGPSVPRAVYAIWVVLQALLLGLAVPALLGAAIGLNLGWFLIGMGLFVASFLISMGGAGLWPGLGELFVDETGHFMALEFPRSAVCEIDLGRGWSKGGFGAVLFPYVSGINQMAEGHAVSFFAPDERGHEVRFALHLNDAEKARQLHALLNGWG
jgi:hypothetical protein